MGAVDDLVRRCDDLFAVAAGDAAAKPGLPALRKAWRGHEAIFCGDADAVRIAAPQFYARLEAAVLACRGTVLEIGCSIGQITRWIAAEDAVKRVFAVDRDRAALAVLRAAAPPKTSVYAAEELEPSAVGRVDTLVLCELIEHVTTRDERNLLQRYARCLSHETRFVISTPVGFLEDPDHVRGFSKTQFVEHVEGLYGPIETLDYRSGYSQLAVGRLERLGQPYRG